MYTNYGQSQLITPQYRQYALQIVLQLMSDNRIEPGIIQAAQQLLSSDPQWIGSLDQEMTRILSTPGISDASGGVNAQAFAQAIYPWASNVVQLLRNAFAQQQAQMPRGPWVGGGQPMSALGGVPVMGPTGMGYDDAHHQPQTAAEHVQQPPQPTQPIKRPQEVIMPSDTTPNLRFAHGEFEYQMNGFMKDTYSVAEYQNSRVTWAVLDKTDRVQRRIDVIRQLVRNLPAEAQRGHYAIRVNYQLLVTIRGVATDVFLKLRDRVRMAMNSGRWQDALQWSEISHSCGKLVEQVVVEEINQQLRRRLRRSISMADAIWIQSISDLGELLSAEFDHPVTAEPRYDKLVRDIINAVIRDVFLDEDVVTTPDNGFGDMLLADDIVWSGKDMSKYDLAAPSLDDTVRKRVVGEILGVGTVLRLPRSLIYTNAIDGATLGLIDTKFVTTKAGDRHTLQAATGGNGTYQPFNLDRLGLFGGIVREQDLTGVDDVIARLPAVPPWEFLSSNMLLRSIDGGTQSLIHTDESIYW